MALQTNPNWYGAPKKIWCVLVKYFWSYFCPQLLKLVFILTYFSSYTAAGQPKIIMANQWEVTLTTNQWQVTFCTSQSLDPILGICQQRCNLELTWLPAPGQSL